MSTATIDTARQAARSALADGRRFTDADMTADLIDGATAYAQQYDGTFSFMTEMRDKASGRRGLSIPQARGVMNCMLASERNAQPAETIEFPKIAAMLAAAREHLRFPRIRLAAADGQEFAVALAGERSKEPGSVVITQQSPEGRRFLGRISADGAFRGSPSPAILAALKAFAGDPETVAREYGKLTGACCFCGLELRDARSTSVGYGPTCAKNYGVRWGAAVAA